jgi:hypothetical protein
LVFPYIMPTLLSEGIDDISNGVICGYLLTSNGQHVRYVLNAFNPCPHSHVKRLDVEGWIKLRWKHNVEVKIKCPMQNERIDDLSINHFLVPLHKQEQMSILNAKEMESSSKIDLNHVLWRMSIKDAYIFRVLVTTKLSKERCIYLIMGGRLFWVAQRHD